MKQTQVSCSSQSFHESLNPHKFMSNRKPIQSIAFLGMGLMGTRMSINLLRAGFQVHGYNRTHARTEPVVTEGGIAYLKACDAARDADAIISCVTDGPDVETVLFGPDGASSAARKDALVIDMSTIAPQTSISMGERLSAMGIRFIEAPVTGGTVGAEKGTLSILVGGDAEDLADAMPVLEAMGRNITHCGPWGCGQGVKLCNQIMGAMNILGVCEAMALAKGLGIDPSLLSLALQGGAATSWALQNLAPKISARDWSPGFMIDTQQKDMRLVAQAAEEAQVALPGSALVTQLWRSAQAHGEGADGIHALFKVLERMNHADGG
jgi:3-hydroxyisobutyrate dehydrogenase-like beta-hydroxyacid dehydrogenase